MEPLYKISEEIARAQAEIQAMGLSEEEEADSLAAMIHDRGVKREALIAHIKSIKAEYDLFSSEIETLSKRSDSISRNIDFYEGYLLADMKKSGDSFSGDGIHTCKIKKGSVRCVITGDVDPAYLVEVPVRFYPNKTLIKKAIQSGEKVGGAELGRGPDRLKF